MEWRDIGSAPKDGRLALVYRPPESTMSENFKPDWRVSDDLPDGYNDLPVKERERICSERLRLLHIYAQTHEHGNARIVGNPNGLIVLRDAIDAALKDKTAQTVALVADGEGYRIDIERNDREWRGGGWDNKRLPYCREGWE